jgi:hypothetical protein
LQLADIRRRVKRLERLAMWLSKELSIIGKGEDPLLYRERKQCMESMRHALSGVEVARIILAKAAQRLEGVKPSGQLPKRQQAVRGVVPDVVH